MLDMIKKIPSPIVMRLKFFYRCKFSDRKLSIATKLGDRNFFVTTSFLVTKIGPISIAHKLAPNSPRVLLT
jgi:hypothetical protein